MAVTTLTSANEDSPPGFEIAVHHSIQGPKELAVSRIKGLRGDLRYNEETYKLVKGMDEGTFMSDPTYDIYPNPVIKPCNLAPDLKVCWHMKIGDEVLHAGLALDGIDGRYGFVALSPALLLSNLAAALIVEDCPHDTDSALNCTEEILYLHRASKPYAAASLSQATAHPQLGVIVVDGADDLRLFASACADQPPVVLRKSVCLLCCLDVCRKANFQVLVL